MKIGRFALGAMLGVALPLAVLASPAQADSVPRARITSAVTEDAAAPAALTEGAAGSSSESSPCVSVGDNLNNRTFSCAKLSSRVTVEEGNKVSVLTVVVSHNINLDVRSTRFSDTVSINFASLTGDASISGLTFSLSAACGTGCSALVSGLQKVPAVLGSTATGSVTFTANVAAGAQSTAKATYNFTPALGRFPSTPFTGSSPAFRCDAQIGSTPGCVFPDYTPTMTSTKQLPDIAANIRKVQAAGGYGAPGSSKPLHRLADDAQAARNRRAVCGNQTSPQPGVLTCDEYPFASTKEGGTSLPPSARGTAWVPDSEQDSQADFISSFYQGQRLLKGDPFWVEV